MKGQKTMIRKRVPKALLFLLLMLSCRMAEVLEAWTFHLKSGRSMWDFFVTACAVGLVYQVVSLVIETVIRRRKGPEGEASMLTGFLRIVAILAVLIAAMYSAGVLKTLGVVVAGFTGMLLGWSLQAPVSGLAAWVLITLMRPFRISDRVQFPSLGLTGDVKRVGAMYTMLDQVGGTVGSEEPIGRDILIPNAMLFGQVAVNYTRNTMKTTSPYFLDEVVIRLTYDSDWDTAEEILRSAARNVTAEVIKETGHEPYVRSDIWDYGILMRLRYMTMAMDRARITHEIVRHIFKEIQANPRVDMAIPFVYSYRKSSSALDRHLYPESKSETLEIEIDNIEESAETTCNHWQESDIETLMLNIKENGLLQPLVLQRKPDGRYLLLAGALRLLACKRLGWKAVPAIVRDHECGITGTTGKS